MTNTPAPGADLATEELRTLLNEYGNAEFDCGEHNSLDENQPSYDTVLKRADDARKAIMDFFLANLAAVPASERAQPQPDDTPGSISWRTADISWACAALKEHTIFDADALQREWNAMKAIALAAAPAPVSGMPAEPRNFCATCGKPTPPGSIHTCTPPLPAAPAPTEQAERPKPPMTDQDFGTIVAECMANPVPPLNDALIVEICAARGWSMGVKPDLRRVAQVFWAEGCVAERNRAAAAPTVKASQSDTHPSATARNEKD